METSKYKYEFFSGFRKNSKLLLLTDEQQIFRQKNVYKDYTRYKCYFEKCNVTVSVKSNGDCEQLSLECHHNHPPPTDVICKFKLIGNVKQECEKKVATKRKGVREIFDEECLKSKKSASGVSFTKMKRQLQRIRNSGMPKSPTSPHEIKVLFDDAEFFKEYAMSKHIEKPFYQATIIEDNFAYSVFLSPTISSIMQKKSKGRRYIIDGTFKTVPSCGHKQLLIISCHFMDHTFPFIYVLMTKKSKEAYKHLFQYINRNLFQFEASAFHTDYEIALRNALEEVFPTAVLSGCWFHYCQALRRRSQKITSFVSFIKTNKNCNTWYRKMLSLPLLCPDHIEEMFLLLKNEVLEFPQNTQECLNIFVRYFETQWMSKITPSGFSVYNEIVRTTSALEGFNSQLSRKLQKHGRFFQYLEVIRDEDFTQSVSFTQTAAGMLSVLPRKRRPQKCRDKQISELTEKLSRGRITATDFITTVTNKDNQIVTADEVVEEPDDDYSTETEDAEENAMHLSQATQILKCIICLEDPRSVLLQPCRHFKLCSTCYEKLEAKSKNNNSPILCPYCRQIVESSLKIFQ